MTIIEPKIVFLHYRNLKDIPAADGGVQTAIDSNSGATVALTQLPDGVLVMATAYCHEKDNYNKHTGRAKAGGRLLSEAYRETINTVTTVGEAIAEIDREMWEEYNYVRHSKKQRTRKAS